MYRRKIRGYVRIGRLRVDCIEFDKLYKYVAVMSQKKNKISTTKKY